MHRGKVPLREALAEAAGLYLWDEPVELQPETLAVGAGEIAVRRRPVP